MSNLQNRNNVGLTFVEVLLALFIMGSLLTSLFLTQDAILSKISYYSILTDAIILSKKKLFDVWFGKQKNSSKNASKNPEGIIAISYKEYDLKNASKFKKFPHLWMEKVTSSWRDLRGKHEEIVVNFVLKPKAQE